MKLTGAHSILYSSDPDADRQFLKDVLGFPHVDVGGGWLIFGLPPGELAVHPATQSGKQEFYLMCDDIENFVDEMRDQGVPCTDVHEEPWGRLVDITLPGGGILGAYEPRHQRPPSES